MRIPTDNQSEDAPVAQDENTNKGNSDCICSIWVNKTKKGDKYLGLYDESIEGQERVKYNLFKPRPSDDAKVADYEFYDKELKKVTVKANIVQYEEREVIKVSFFDDNGAHNRSFVAYAVKNRKSEKSPDYVGYKKTLKITERA